MRARACTPIQLVIFRTAICEVLPEDDVTLYRPESPAEVPSPPTETVVDEFPSPTSLPDYSPVPVEARAIYGEQTLAGLLAEG